METNVINPIPEKEYERLIELSELDLDYSNLQEKFSDLTKLAAKIAGTDISLINILDNYTQWSVSQHGLPITQMPREDSVCQYTIMGNDAFEVERMDKDDRFKMKDYVSSDINLKYYYGIPLKSKEGLNLGALCVMDEDTKELTPEKKEMLEIIAHEIVDRMYDIKALRELRSEVEEAKEMKRKLSHDIRGPLGGMVGLAQIIEDSGSNSNLAEILELAEMIRKGGQSLLELADDILSAESLKGRQPKDNEYNLESLRDKIIELYHPQAAAKDIKLKVENRTENARIPFPKAKILQVVGNVISNAIKFTPKSGKVEVFQDLVREEDTSLLKITVKDNGVGIPADKINEIKSGNAKSTQGTTGETGYGFGLSLVQHLVHKMNGTLSIESEVGDGCEFTISIPVV